MSTSSLCELSLIIADPRWTQVLPDCETFSESVLQAAAAHQRVGAHALTVLLSNDDTLRALNSQFRGKDAPTNVLAFPTAMPTPEGAAFLGDIAISFERVRDEATTAGLGFGDRLAHMLIHGYLHLLGYDHQIDEDAEKMEAGEIAVLGTLGIANPYEEKTA
jgi:probable rRNA maturation factor